MNRVYRCARGGGVPTYSMFLVIWFLHFECIFVKITLHANMCITVGNFYKPPFAPTESLNNMIFTISSVKFNTLKVRRKIALQLMLTLMDYALLLKPYSFYHSL